MAKSYLSKEFFRFIFILLGLTGLGIIAYEILVKWNFLRKGYSSVWIIVFILTLFVCKAFFNSSYISNHPGFPPIVTKRIVMIINTLFVIITILLLISIPFIWYGTIEELAKTEGYSP